MQGFPVRDGESYIRRKESVCSSLMTYLECGDRCSSEVLSFLAIADGLKMETGMPRIIREHAEEFSKG